MRTIEFTASWCRIAGEGNRRGVATLQQTAVGTLQVILSPAPKLMSINKLRVRSPGTCNAFSTVEQGVLDGALARHSALRRQGVL